MQVDIVFPHGLSGSIAVEDHQVMKHNIQYSTNYYKLLMNLDGILLWYLRGVCVCKNHNA